MATPAQIDANRLNAQISTGPRYGFAGKFSVLACEDRDEFRSLLEDYSDEYHPVSPTERFLVAELAQAQWRIMRADTIESELLNPGDNPTYAKVAEAFKDSDALIRLQRYAQSARRAYYKAQEKLEKLRREAAGRATEAKREETRDFERRLEAYMEAPPPGGVKLALVPQPPPMPVHLQKELEAHRRRDPLFDPRKDTPNMSKQLRKWYQKYPDAA